MNYITIATDISNSTRPKITTWACYIRHKNGVIKKSGQFKKYYKSPAIAETYALINAIVIASKSISDFNKSKIIIYNEVDHSLKPLKTKSGRIRQRDMDRSNAIQEIALPILQQAVDWEKRDVKAHFTKWRESDNRAKYIMNQWCDKESRRLMRDIRYMLIKNACVC